MKVEIPYYVDSDVAEQSQFALPFCMDTKAGIAIYAVQKK
jgi:hypothetical protein